MQGLFKKQNNPEPVDTSRDEGANRLLCKDRNSRRGKRRWQCCFSERGEEWGRPVRGHRAAAPSDKWLIEAVPARACRSSWRRPSAEQASGGRARTPRALPPLHSVAAVQVSQKSSLGRWQGKWRRGEHTRLGGSCASGLSFARPLELYGTSW